MIGQTRIMIGSSEDEEEKEEKTPEVHIQKINGGFLVKTCGSYTDEQIEFVKNLAKAPAIVKKLMKIDDKNYSEMKQMISSKDEEE